MVDKIWLIDVRVYMDPSMGMGAGRIEQNAAFGRDAQAIKLLCLCYAGTNQRALPPHKLRREY